MNVDILFYKKINRQHIYTIYYINKQGRYFEIDRVVDVNFSSG